MDDRTKTCTKCGQSKAIAAFYLQKHGKFGVMSWCKACHNVNRRDRRHLDAEHTQENRRRYWHRYMQRLASEPGRIEQYKAKRNAKERKRYAANREQVA